MLNMNEFLQNLINAAEAENVAGVQGSYVALKQCVTGHQVVLNSQIKSNVEILRDLPINNNGISLKIKDTNDSDYEESGSYGSMPVIDASLTLPQFLQEKLNKSKNDTFKQSIQLILDKITEYYNIYEGLTSQTAQKAVTATPNPMFFQRSTPKEPTQVSSNNIPQEKTNLLNSDDDTESNHCCLPQCTLF